LARITREHFGRTDAGAEVSRFALTNRRGTRAVWLDWGATLAELWLPDREGRPADVVLGFDRFEPYARNAPYFGCTVGRVANRIAGARFALDGREYRLAANEGAHHLHGGERGFDRALWGARELPGAEADVLRLEYRAETDAPTLVNLTNHAYWNLAGDGDVLGHELRLHADRYTEVGPDRIPTGRRRPVAGTPLDFTSRKAIGRDLGALGPGYDHDFVLADAPRGEALPCAELSDPASGRCMRVCTSEPSVQLYTGNSLDGVAGKRGRVYARHAGLCLETQRPPDAVHHPGFPSVVLRPGETYRQTTTCAFGLV
jgi:aldose 1-epimerase